jgi:hypothetical protein
MTVRRLLLLSGFALFVGTGAYSLLLPALQDRRLPSRADALLGAIEARTHAPFTWFDERADLDLENAWRFDRVWMVHLPQVTGREPSELAPSPARVVARSPCGDRLELLEVETPRATLRFDLLRDAGQAAVRRVFKDGTSKACPWDGSQHRCEATEWKNVGVRWKDVGGSRRTCLYVEPTPDDSRVEVSFPDVRLGARTLIWGGLSISGARKPSGGEVTLRVLVGGKPRVEHREPPKEYRWNRFEIDTSEVAGEPTELAFVVSAKKSGWRQFCLDALSIDPLTPLGEP